MSQISANVFCMAGKYEYWVITLPSGALLKGEDLLGAINRELAELAERGWEVAGFHPAPRVGASTFVLKKDK